eukprot:TRINITY_DN26284_c0_g1_i2.p1 TRINITY_DN26284_c0_g1~~TRINITY_DN26284_c0_g1_i2.p1  ORF type:complete len:103 (+),score=19.24 TRINITY_DN26284_c0_g1_i2:455-763(+)
MYWAAQKTASILTLSAVSTLQEWSAAAVSWFFHTATARCTARPVTLLVQALHCHESVSYTHLRAHETPEHLVCRLLLEKKKKKTTYLDNWIPLKLRQIIDKL